MAQANEQTSLLRDICDRLTIGALVKVAQISYDFRDVASRSWHTWRDACQDSGMVRVPDDKCWMETFARNLRQLRYTNYNASEDWLCSIVPEKLAQAVVSFLPQARKMALFFRTDWSRAHLVLWCDSNAAPWLVLSTKLKVVLCFAGSDKRPVVSHETQAIVAKLLQSSWNLLRREHVGGKLSDVVPRRSVITGHKRRGHAIKPPSRRGTADP